MKIDGILANNIDLTPAIEKRVQTRVAKLGKLVKRYEPATIAVEVGKPSNHHKKGQDVFYAEFRVTLNGKDFYSNKSEPDLYKAIEKVRDDMYQQINRWKKKEVSQRRKEGGRIKRMMRWGRSE